MRNLLLVIILFFSQIACMNENQQAEKILRNYIERKVELIRGYTMESAVALWNATESGKEKDYQKLIDIELDFNKSNQNVSNYFAPDRITSLSQNIFSNFDDFELLKKLKFSKLIKDSLLSRQLNVLYQAFMGPQIEPEKYKNLITSEIKLWQAFSVLKINIDGKMFSYGQIDSIRKNSTTVLTMKKIADAMQHQGTILAPDIIRMIKDRNEFAANFGYPNYYQLALETKDQTPEEVKKMLDEIELKTRDQYFEAKKIIDKLIAKRFKISVNELQPWLFNDERTSYLPKYFTLRMDSLFANIDPVEETARFFDGIGINIQDVIDNSDFSNGPGKSTLTAMINVDFKNDIRLVAGITKTHDGMCRMMHLGGHASHYKSISDDIPYLIKAPTSVIYEGVSKYFESLVSNYNWLRTEIKIDEQKQKEVVLICHHLHQVDRLFRCRIQLVMAEFEREIYQNPDQDLDLLWNNLNRKYLGISYPDDNKSGFWAANKFATSLACNIHNLVLADVFASQLQHYIENVVIKDETIGYRNNKDIGKYLVENLYQYGNLLPWNQLIEKATGEPLNTAYFVNYMIGDESEQNAKMKIAVNDIKSKSL